VGLQEAPDLPDPKQNHSENAKSRNSKQEFFVQQGKEKLKERTSRERLGTSGLTRSSPLTRPEAKSFRKCQKRKFQTGIFL